MNSHLLRKKDCLDKKVNIIIDIDCQMMYNKNVDILNNGHSQMTGVKQEENIW